MSALARLEQWIERGAGIVCSGADKAPLKLTGANGGSFNTDFHRSTAAIAELVDAGRARGFGISFADPACPFVCVDVDIKGKEEVDGKRKPIPNAIAEQWMRNTLPVLVPSDETYLERTPSGGWHFIFAKPQGWDGRAKVAYTFPDGSGVEVFVSTGWVRMAPSPDYEVLADRSPAPLDLEELAGLVGSVEMLASPEPVAPRRPLALAGSEESVIDWANRNLSTVELLTDAGWAVVGQHGAAVTLRRPGKSRGISANYNHLGTGTLKVFTDATPFDTQGTHSPYWVYVVTKHQGDKHAATRALGEQMRREQERTFHPSTTTKELEPTAPEDWPEPIPLGDARELPPFPVEVLPRWMGEQAIDAARRIKVSVDVPAQLGLAALATVCAGKVKVQIVGGWAENVNLYVAIALPPSSGKSPAFDAMVDPIEKLEEELTVDAEERIAEAEQLKRRLEKQMKVKEESINPADVEEATSLRRQLFELDVPARPKLIVSDITQEKLGQTLLEQGGRIALLSPEGGMLNMMLGRYSDKASLDEYLQAWGGETLRVDRMGRPSVLVPNATLTIGVAIQPVVLEGLGDPLLRRKGLTARFMYSIPPSNVGQRDMRTIEPENEAVKSRYWTTLTGLARRMASFENPGTVSLTAEAREIFGDWRQWLEDRRGPSGELGTLDEWTGKLEACTVRVAGLLHVAENGPTGEVDAATMRKAIEVARYWLEHAKAVHDIWGADPDLGKARILLRWIIEEKIGEFSVRDAHYARKKHFARVDDLVAPLEILAERLWIKPTFDGPLIVGKRGMPSPTFQVSPYALRSSATESQSVVAHVAHVPRSDFENSLSHSVCEEGDGGVATWATWATTPHAERSAPEPVDKSSEAEKNDPLDPAVADALERFF